MGKTRNCLIILCLVLFVVGTASAAAPVAQFTGTPINGPSPLTVTFTDTSTGSPTGWAWYFGDETYKASWTQMTASAGWTWRRSSVVMPDGSIVLMGGEVSGSSYQSDVWRSTDKGATWTQMTASAGWSARHDQSSVVMPGGSIVLMGGYGNGGPKNDVWRSTDKGATWTKMTASPGWGWRYGHTSVAMPDGSIVLMGGSTDDYHQKNDVWRSTDNGAEWTLVNASAGWTARYRHTSVVMPDGSIVLMGGKNISGPKNDVWRSTDKGATWTQMTSSAGWTARYGHTSVAMPDGSIVLMGGISTGNKNDVWRSTDNGATWTQMTADAVWSARYFHNSVAMPDGSIVLMGGYDGSKYKNDVWRLMPAGSSAKNPSHTYTTPGIYTVALQVYNTKGYNSIRKIGYITVTGPSKIGVFRSSTWQFLLDSNGNGIWNGAPTDKMYRFGLSTDVPVTGDWNGNKKTEIGVFRNSIRQWLLDYNGNGIWDGAPTDKKYMFGLSGDVPVTGDWDGDSKTEIGVFRNSTRQWLLDYNGNGILDGAPTDKMYRFGLSTDVPVTGDWDGNGKTEIGVFRNSTRQWLLDYNGNGIWDGAPTDKLYKFILSTDTPITGDWDGNKKTEIGVFRNSTRQWLLDYNGNGIWDGTPTDKVYMFGLSTDTPISGKW